MSAVTYYPNFATQEHCPSYAPVLGFLACAISIVFSVFGASYGTLRSARGLLVLGQANPDQVMKNIIPIIMSGVLGIYGLVASIIINGRIPAPNVETGQTLYSLYTGSNHLAASLCVGVSCLASGLCIGISSDAAARAISVQNQMSLSWKKMGFSAAGKAGGTGGETKDSLFIGTTLVLVFASNLSLYGLIVALILSQQEFVCTQIAVDA